MALLYPYEGRIPRVHPSAWLADNAVLIGDVEIGPEASVWFGCTLRGDVGAIRVGARSNVQDGTVVHATFGVSFTEIGAEVTVGHAVVLHGCVVRDRALIGMGAIVLDQADIGAQSVVGAGALVTARTQVAPRKMVLGRPARVVRDVTEAEARLGVDGADHYVAEAARYRGISAIGATTAPR
ncbi:MAG: gamma carbonic anhydrase family protein [Polyangiaceae bacterium]|nr:gamma carbonic anhydrase family protein [Polyangiaceae bacterium]